MNKKIPLLALLGVLSGSASAGSMGEPQVPPTNYVFEFGFGPAWTKSGDTQTISQSEDILRKYVAKKEQRNLLSSEIFLGIERSYRPGILYQLGMALAMTDSTKLQGGILEDADPRFNVLSYSYKVNHKRATVKGALILEKKMLDPYISGSVGVASNRAYKFEMAPKEDGVLVGSGFQSNDKTSFVYTVGAGVQKSISASNKVGVGYEFADWGKNQLTRAPWQTFNSGLAMSHFYTHQLKFTVTAVA